MKLFFDTSFLYAVYLKQTPKAVEIWFNLSLQKFSSEYAIKELRRILLRYGATEDWVNYAIYEIRSKCTIISINYQHESGILLEDKSDIPIVAGARACGATLVTTDRKLHQQASKYVKTAFPHEL